MSNLPTSRMVLLVATGLILAALSPAPGIAGDDKVAVSNSHSVKVVLVYDTCPTTAGAWDDLAALAKQTETAPRGIQDRRAAVEATTKGLPAPGLSGADWLILGAHTGPRAMKPHPARVVQILDAGRHAGMPVFIKNNLHWPRAVQQWPAAAQGIGTANQRPGRSKQQGDRPMDVPSSHVIGNNYYDARPHDAAPSILLGQLVHARGIRIGVAKQSLRRLVLQCADSDFRRLIDDAGTLCRAYQHRWLRVLAKILDVNGLEVPRVLTSALARPEGAQSLGQGTTQAKPSDQISSSLVVHKDGQE